MNKHSDKQIASTCDDNRERKFHLWGWGLFIICAVFFIAASLKDDNTLTFIGSIIFLIACIIFLFPLIFSGNKSKNNKEKG
jgi:predicted membrane channel-forming protein YqfA (hemolysin III family)